MILAPTTKLNILVNLISSLQAELSWNFNMALKWILMLSFQWTGSILCVNNSKVLATYFDFSIISKINIFVQFDEDFMTRKIKKIYLKNIFNYNTWKIWNFEGIMNVKKWYLTNISYWVSNIFRKKYKK